jgi:dihydrodipicolinate synthase/N-acetylneuraminate lyase
MAFQWKGVFPALTTKFSAKDELDLPMFEKNLQAQLDAGVDGIVLGGSLGEASVLTTSEKEILVKFAIERCKDIPVILNIAEGSTKEALQQI